MLSKQIFNRTSATYFAVDASERQFTIPPADDTIDNSKGYLEYVAVSGHMETDSRYIGAPIPGMPSFIPELGCLLFASKAELVDAVNKHGSGSSLLAIWFNNMQPFVHGAYRCIINMSDTDYFFIDGKDIFRIPRTSPGDRAIYLKKQTFPQERLANNDLIVVMTVVRQDSAESPSVHTFDNQFIPKRMEGKEYDPVLVVSNGLWVFKSHAGAEQFLERYPDFIDYFMEKALDAVERNHKEEMRLVIEAHKKERSNIMKNAILLAGTTILGVIAEKVITHYLTQGEAKK